MKERREKERRAKIAAKFGADTEKSKRLKKMKARKMDITNDRPALSPLPRQPSIPPPDTSKSLPSSNPTASTETSETARQDKSPSQPERESSSAPLQSQAETPSKLESPLQSSYDKRMPPPSPGWRAGIPVRKRKRPPQEEPASSQKNKNPLAEEEMLTLLKRKGVKVSNLDDPIYKMVQAAQKREAPPAKGSLITGKRDQLDLESDDEMMEDEEGKMFNEYLRAGDDRIGILPDGWKEVQDIPSNDEPSRKRSHDIDGCYAEQIQKRRRLKSDYCPAMHTTWKPAWLDTIQCYPVDETGEDMSDIEYLRGDQIHRSADRMKWILEKECMYIPSHQVDELLSIANDTVKTLERTKEFYEKEHRSKVRIERHESM